MTATTVAAVVMMGVIGGVAALNVDPAHAAHEPTCQYDVQWLTRTGDLVDPGTVSKRSAERTVVLVLDSDDRGNVPATVVTDRHTYRGPDVIRHRGRTILPELIKVGSNRLLTHADVRVVALDGAVCEST